MPRIIACAVVRDDPPQVYAAEDLETLNWVLALRLVAATRSGELPEGVPGRLRRALLDEQWGDAVELWMSHAGVAVDVYSSMDLHTAADVEMAPIEMQFRPLFED
jgi:hypothetical protein